MLRTEVRKDDNEWKARTGERPKAHFRQFPFLTVSKSSWVVSSINTAPLSAALEGIIA